MFGVPNFIQHALARGKWDVEGWPPARRASPHLMWCCLAMAKHPSSQAPEQPRPPNSSPTKHTTSQKLCGEAPCTPSAPLTASRPRKGPERALAVGFGGAASPTPAQNLSLITSREGKYSWLLGFLSFQGCGHTLDFSRHRGAAIRLLVVGNAPAYLRHEASPGERKPGATDFKPRSLSLDNRRLAGLGFL